MAAVGGRWRTGIAVGVTLLVALVARHGGGADITAHDPLLQSPGYGNPPDIDVWRQHEQRDGLKPYPPAPPGVPNPPGGLFQFGGGGRTSFGSPDLGVPFAETWFNVTHHRVTDEPSQGVACFSCHVNGHTNGAVELAPDSRPNYARLRMDTPTMRGNYAQLLFSSKRSIRTMDHFAEVEEYFDGDTTLLAAIGGRTLQKAQSNHMGDFNALLDFPPAPKLDALNRLVPSKATPQELRGEALFTGKAQCAACHPPVAHFTDNTMHDLKVERFYAGRAEGPIKTFPLRGIKDSPPYFHDGRLLTLEDTVGFFDLILSTRLSADEKKDLVAYLRAL